MSKSVSQLTALTSPATGDLLHIVRSNVDYKILYENLVSDVNGLYGNTIFVDSINGNDSTGEVENPAKPFLTIAAAHTASAAYYTGGTAPTSTNVIVMKLRGTFSEDVLLRTYHNYDINDSIITGKWYDSSIVVCKVHGIGTLMANIGVSAYVFNISYGSSITIYADIIVGTILTGHTDADVFVRARSLSSTSYVFDIQDGRAECEYTDISAVGKPAIHIGESCRGIFSNCQITSDDNCIDTNSTASNTSVLTIRRCRVGTTKVNGHAISLTTNTGSSMSIKIISSTLVANGTGKSINAAQATTVDIHGACQTNLTHDTTDVTLAVGTVANGRFLIDAAVI